MQVTFKKNPIMVKQLFPTNHIFYLNIFPLFRCDKEGLKKYAGYLFLLEQNNVREGKKVWSFTKPGGSRRAPVHLNQTNNDLQRTELQNCVKKLGLG